MVEGTESNESVDFSVSETTVVDDLSGASTQVCAPTCQNSNKQNGCNEFWSHVGSSNDPPGTLLKWAARLELESSSLHDLIGTLKTQVDHTAISVSECEQRISNMAINVDKVVKKLSEFTERVIALLELSGPRATVSDATAIASTVATKLLEDQAFGEDTISYKFDRLERGILNQSRGINDIKRSVDVVHRHLRRLENGDTIVEEDDMFVESPPAQRRRTISSIDHLDRQPVCSRKMSLL